MEGLNLSYKFIGIKFTNLAVVTEEEIFQMRANVIPNSTNKSTKLGIKIFRGNQCFNIQVANMSSALTTFRNSDRQAPLMPLSLNNNCSPQGPFTAPCQSPIQYIFDLMIYLAFSLSGEGHCYRFPQLQQALCSGGGNSPQHRH